MLHSTSAQADCDLSSLHRFSSTLLEKAVSGDRKGNVLVLGHRAVPAPECSWLSSEQRAFGIAVYLLQGRSQSPDTAPVRLDCSSTHLPFQDAAFRTVILYLVARDGTERELHEGCRVLAPGGDLFVLGLNRRSWRGVRAHRRGPVPGMNVAAVRDRLQAMDMEIDCTLGSGLMGRPRPLMEWNRMSSLALPFADLIVLRARHRNRPARTRLQLKKFPARIVPTATNVT